MRYEFDKEDCKDWQKERKKNPQTGRKIDPKAEFGVYEILESQCKKFLTHKKENASKTTLKLNSVKHKQIEKDPEIIVIFMKPILSVEQQFKQCVISHCNHINQQNISQIYAEIDSILQSTHSIYNLNKSKKSIDNFLHKIEDNEYVKCVTKNCTPFYKQLFRNFYTHFQKVKESFKMYLEQNNFKQKEKDFIFEFLSEIDYKIRTIYERDLFLEKKSDWKSVKINSSNKKMRKSAPVYLKNNNHTNTLQVSPWSETEIFFTPIITMKYLTRLAMLIMKN